MAEMTHDEIILKLDLYAAAIGKLSADIAALRAEVVKPPPIDPPIDPPPPPPPPPLEISPDGTTVPPAVQIVDAERKPWTIVDGKVYIDTRPAGYTNGTDRLLKYESRIYHRNLAGTWYGWNGSTWAAVREPGVVVVDPPPPPIDPPTAPSSAALAVSGKNIVDAAGNVVILRGVSTIGLRNVVADRRGIQHIVDYLAAWKCKMIRLPVYPSQYISNPAEWNDRYIGPAVRACVDKKIYALIDWHAFDNPHSAQYTSWTKTFWADMARRYKDNPYVLFELYNEPVPPETGGVGPTSLRWRDWAQVRCDEIREIAPDTIIMVGGPHYTQWMGWPALSPIRGKNIAYVWHCYPGGWYIDASGRNLDQGGWQLHGGQTADKYPLFITEFGFGSANYNETQGELSSFGLPFKAWAERKGVSWTAWVIDHQWHPVMLADNTFTRTTVFGQMVKDWLAEKA